jgi:HKD family nuclease
MTINFIGHGLSSKKDAETVGNYLFSSFQDDSFNNFIGLSAYATIGGVKKLNSALKKAKTTYKELKFFFGIEDKITSKEVFQALLDIEVDCFIYHTITEKTFHPKVYIFEGERKFRIILGSSNFTTQGLYNQNIEASVVVDFVIGDLAGIKFLNQIKDYFKQIINIENENVKKVDAEFLDLLLQNGLVVSEKDRTSKKKFDDDNLGMAEEYFPEVEKVFQNEMDLGGILTNDRSPSNPSPNYTKNPLSQHYFETWDSYFESLKKHKEKFGHTNVQGDQNDESLVDWCRKVKNLKNNNILPIEHEKKLNSIGFYWKTLRDWNSEQVWNENFAEFNQFYSKYRTFQVPKRTHKKLSNWIITARLEYHKGLLLEYQVKNLDDLDPNWKLSAKEKNDESWFDNLLQLEDFKRKNGHCNAPQKVNSLGRWVNDQRTLKKRGRLSEEKEQLLTNLGVVWDIKDNDFEIMIERLTQYKNKFGNFDVPLDYEDKQLAVYVFGIKSRGTIPERKQRLDELGFNWEKHYSKKVEKPSNFITKEWLQKLNKVKLLKSEGVDINNITSEQSHLKNIKLYILNQQKRYRFDELKDEQIELLKSAGVLLEKTNKQDQRWATFYDLLILFKNENGHCRVTSAFDEELKNWIGTLRRSYRDNILEKSKIDKLNQIGFEWVVGKSKINK